MVTAAAQHGNRSESPDRAVVYKAMQMVPCQEAIKHRALTVLTRGLPVKQMAIDGCAEIIQRK